jgi:hypothetical protein
MFRQRDNIRCQGNTRVRLTVHPLWLWPELSASRYCGQPLIFLFLADVAAALPGATRVN